MEDGKVYWSNWAGLSEIATAVQIQRGLGSSKLAISSVGATINVVTKATDMVSGGRFSAMVGNDGYMKYVGSYSTGLSENGWGASVLLSHWQGNGYNDGTQGQGQTYFFSVGYKPSDKHQFNLSVTGAPQWHYQNYTKNLSSYDRDGDGDITNTEQRYNSNWGMYKGKEYSLRENFYHKPVANLNWDWNISDKSSLSTVLYGSTGAGGGTGGYGSGYYNYGSDGQLDFDGIETNNRSIVNDGSEDWHIPGKTIGSYGDGAAVRRASMNMHRWLGAVVNYNHEISENLSFNVGTDLRTYYGKHFRLVDNLWGLDGYWDDNYNGDGFRRASQEDRFIPRSIRQVHICSGQTETLRLMINWIITTPSAFLIWEHSVSWNTKQISSQPLFRLQHLPNPTSVSTTCPTPILTSRFLKSCVIPDTISRPEPTTTFRRSTMYLSMQVTTPVSPSSTISF